MPANRAAYLPCAKAPAFEVSEAPYTPASADTLVIRTRAVAINPIDWIIQGRGNLAFSHLQYPFILGHDVAGEVVEVGGEAAKHFQVGDRVGGYPQGSDKTINSAAEGGFQEYTVLRPQVTFKLPEHISYEAAAAIPLGFITAAAALFEKSQLALSLPTEPRSPARNQVVIIWGGSTSVGCNAIQLAVAAGYQVYTTSSPRNFALMKELGASHVFDYKSRSVVADILATLKINGKVTAGALSIGDGAAEHCMSVLSASDCAATARKHVAMATFPVSPEEPKHLPMLRTVAGFASFMVAYKARGLVTGVGSSLVQSTDTAKSPEGRLIFEQFLPQALRAGSFVPAPRADVVGTGLEFIQKAVDLQRKGVSAKKIVVKL